MNAGDILIVLAALSALGAAFARVWGMKSQDRRLAEASAILSIGVFLLVSAALFFLVFLFSTSDMSYLYVWSYSSTDLGMIYKLSGVWAGASGSFLLWIWLMALVLAVEVILEPKRKYLSRRFHGVFQSVLSSVIFVFLLLLMAMELFTRTEDWRLLVYGDGLGLNLQLQTPEMAIHPPVVFAGYAFGIVALAAAVAHFATEDSNWFVVSLPWTRLAWVFLTLGIGIGAIWAYYVLGWGGYWAWDPVETASLLPWLVSTAFLHTQVRHARKGEYTILSPVLGVLSFSSVVFATFATRAGGIWSQSVHTFDGGQTASSGLSRLVELLQGDNVVMGIFTILVATFAIALYMGFSLFRRAGFPEESPPEKLAEYISDRNNMVLTVILLIASASVMLLLMFKNVDVSQAANYDEFNQKMSIFFIALMVAMTICLLWKFVGKEKALWLGLGLIVASAVLGAIVSFGGFGNGLVAFSAPSYAVAIVASAAKLAKSRVTGSARKTLQQIGPNIIHLGVALILLGFVVTTTMQEYPNVGGLTMRSGVVVPLSGEVVVGDYSVELVSLDTRDTGSRSGAYAVDEVRDAKVNIIRDGKMVKESVTLSNLYGASSSGAAQVMDVEVYVFKTVLRDVYISYQWQDNSSALIEVKTLPLMNVLWSGFGLLVIGLVVRLVGWQQAPKAPPARRAKPELPERKDSSSAEKATDYEAQVEEEIRRFKEKRAK